MRNKTFIAIFLSFLIGVLAQIYIGDFQRQPDLTNKIAVIMGGAIGFLIAVIILPSIIALIRFLRKKTFSHSTFAGITYIMLVILSIIMFVGQWNLKAIQESPINNDKDGSLTYKYSPKGCLYEIEFKSKPKINKLSTLEGKSILVSEVSELAMVDDGGYVKSEFAILGRDTVSAYTKQILYNLLTEYSLRNGLSHPELKSTENDLGRQVELRGYKTLKDDKLNERRLIMTAHLYFKENNLLILYGASEAKDYPTPGIIRFLNSVKLNKIKFDTISFSPNEKTKSLWPSRLVSYYSKTFKNSKTKLSTKSFTCFEQTFNQEFSKMIPDWENRELTAELVFDENPSLTERIEMCAAYTNKENIQVTLGPDQINRNQIWTICIIVINNRLRDYDRFPDIEGLRKQGTLASTHSFTINGELVSTQSITMRYLPIIYGTVTVPSFNMRVNGDIIKSIGKTVRVSS